MNKLLIGDGNKVEVYEVKKIYEINGNGNYLPFHGHKIMESDDAKRVLNQLLKYGKGKKVV